MRTGISVAEALQTVLAGAPHPLPEESVSWEAAQNRVLAREVRATRTLPARDCSAMDGYALCSADLAGARAAAPRELSCGFEVAAGAQPERALLAGEAARIFTGAPLPEGADAVVRQEDVEVRGAKLCFSAQAAPGENVRRAGEELRKGETALPAGTVLGPAEIGTLTSLGRTVVHVHRRPRVALLSSGDELVEADGELGEGRIVASNSTMLAAQCREAGALPVNLGIAKDTPQDLTRLFRAGLFADLLVSSAGVSVGDHDHVRPVLQKLGCRFAFFGVQMKPGYPLTYGAFEAQGELPVFGLPGNPVSAMVCFEQFVRPLLLRLAGRRVLERPLLRAVLTKALRKAPGRLHFVRVRLHREAGRTLATPTCNQGSGALHSMVRSDGLLIFDADASQLDEGAAVRVQLLNLDLLAGEAW